ncbi:YjgN family protein [Vogesella indigofera]|uniref:YjgN family protein n=1 Tax=Vogesella indigofera TaxID=45465 RepID=UPI00234F4717|nr:YjgN family protein [Vogesella indigofera]MDC7702271.1 YjgN family protein [Vogesella indigofera]
MNQRDLHPAPPGGKYVLPFAFTATARAYYRLWLVNMVLTIVTLGIYSAWAKVRTQKYLLGHTTLDGGRFDYHGKPIAILKGRLIMLLALAAWTFSESLPLLHAAIALLAVATAPWLGVLALRFRLANTSWNQMRFHFSGSSADSYKAFAKSWALLILSLGLAWPWATQIKQRFITGYSTLGQARLQLQPCAGALYRAALGTTLAAVCYLLGAGMIGGLIWQAATLSGFAHGIAVRFGEATLTQLDIVFFGMTSALWVMATLGYARMAISRVLINHTTLQLAALEARLVWSLPARRMLGLHFSNTLALLLSLGLAWPWIRIRTLRLQLQSLSLLSSSDLSALPLRTSLNRLDDARGDELAELMALDLGW